MKVGITAGVYYPEPGGGGTYLPQLRSDLLAAGHEVSIVCFGEAPSEPGIVRVTRRLPIPLRLLVFGFHSVRLLHDADVFFVNDYGLVGAVLRAVFRRPAVMKVVGDWAWESAVNNGITSVSTEDDPLLEFQRRAPPPRAALRKAIRTWAARLMDRVLVPSHYLADVVASWGVPRSRIVVIHNGVTLDGPGGENGRVGDRIVTVARLVRWKGIDHLIAAVPSLRARRPAVRLRVVGDGPDRPRLERLAHEHGVADITEFVGLVSREEVRRELAAASAFVLPSAYEGLPHVVLEAMAMSCPVVAAAAGGTREVVRDGVDGLLIPYGDPIALAAALMRVLTDRHFAVELGRRGRDRVAEAFAWQATSDAARELILGLGRRANSTASQQR